MPSSTCITVKPHVILPRMCYCIRSYVVDSRHKGIDTHKLNCCARGWVLDCINNDQLIVVLWIMLMLSFVHVVTRNKLNLVIPCLHGVLVELVCHYDSITIGALLLSIFVNDLPAMIDHEQINMYTNDTELHCCSEVFRMIFNLIFAEYKTAWLQINRLMFQSIIVKLIGSWQKLRDHSQHQCFTASVYHWQGSCLYNCIQL